MCIRDRLCTERFCQHSAQLGKEQRLFAESGHSGSAGFLFDICPVVGCQDDDGACLLYTSLQRWNGVFCGGLQRDDGAGCGTGVTVGTLEGEIFFGISENA